MYLNKEILNEKSLLLRRGVMKHRQIDILSAIVFAFLCSNIALDFMSGLLDTNALSQVLRIAFFFVLLYVELLLDRQGFCLLIVGLAFIMMQSFATQVMLQGNMTVSTYFYDISAGIKLLMCIAVFRSVVSLSDNGVFGLEKLSKAFKIAAIYFPILYIGSFLFGLGQSSYWDGSGFKSVFSSLNSVNVSVLVLYVYSIDQFFSNKRWIWIIPVMLNLVSILMLGTKSSYVFAALVFAYYIVVPRGRRLRNIVVAIVMIILAITLIMNIPYFQDSISRVYERQSYLFENRSFIDYLTSGRTWMFELAVAIFWEQSNPLTIIFGGGYYSFHHDLAVASGYLSTNSVRPIEFDWADIIFSYGLPCLILIYGFLVLTLFKGISEAKTKRFYWLALMVMVVFSALGGHVLFEAISSVTLGGVLSGLKLETKPLELMSKSDSSSACT